MYPFLGPGSTEGGLYSDFWFSHAASLMPATVPSASSPPPTSTTPSEATLVAAPVPIVTTVSVPIPISVSAISVSPEGAFLFVFEMLAPTHGPVIVLSLLFDPDGRLLQVLLPLRVCALLAVSAVRTEARQEVRTHLLPDVFLGTPGP